ncbi:MAG: hypothetical protein AB1792_03660 [Candidatus Zixiibacteriota bacterium]
MIDLPIGDIIRDAFRLSWRHKYLWLFGLFASFGAGGGQFRFGRTSLADIEAARAWVLAALGMLLLLGLVIGVVFLILHVITKSALIYNVYQIETDGTHSLSAGWDFGVRRFWSMLGVTLLEVLAAIVLIGGLAFVEVLVFLASVPLGFLSLLFALPLAILLTVILILVWNYAERFVTLEMRGVFDAIGDGWRLFREQWRPSALMLLAKFIIAVTVAIVVGMVGMALAAPAVALWFASKPLAIFYGVIVLFPLFVLVNAYFGTFDSAAWTKAFLQLRAPVYAARRGTGGMDSIPGTAPGAGLSTPPVFE